MKVFVLVISGDFSNGSFQGPGRGEDMSVGNWVDFRGYQCHSGRG